MSGRLHRIMLSRRTSASTNQDALREITTANGFIRRGKQIEAERLFRQVLSRYRHGRTPGDIQAVVDALVGLSDSSVSASRKHSKIPVEQFWFLVRGLTFLRRAKDLLKAQYEQKAKASLTYDGLQSKTRSVHAEAYNVLEKALLGRVSSQSHAGVGRLAGRYRRRDFPVVKSKTEVVEEVEDESLSQEERGRQFLEDFFNLCASKERQKELVHHPSHQLPDFDRIGTNNIQETNRRLGWLHKASPVSASMIDLRYVEPEPTMPKPIIIEEPDDDEDDDDEASKGSKLSPSTVRSEVEGTIINIRERLGMPLSTVNSSPDTRNTTKLSELVRDHRRRVNLLSSKEAHHLIEYEAENIVTSLRTKRANPRLRRAASMMDTSSVIHGEPFEPSGNPGEMIGRRRGDGSAAILKRRNMRRLQRSASRESLSGALSMSCLALDEAVQVSYQSPAAKYRQMRQAYESLGMEECHVEEIDEEEELEEERRRKEEEREEPGTALLHAEWIHTIVHFGNRLDVENDPEAAAMVFGHSLFLYEMLERDVVEVELMAYVMRRLGAIRCHEGNLSGGISLMERAIAIYADLPNADSAMMEQAAVWLEMGNAHLHGISGLDLANQYIAIAVRRHINKVSVRPEDTFLENTHETETLLEPVLVNGENETFLSMQSNARQAFSCYKRCLAMQEFVSKELQPKGFKVRLLTRLGDCNLILEDTSKANDFYEQAQELFANTDTSGLLEENAHVLCMLGIGRFLNGNYSKALALLETAYVILYHRSMENTSSHQKPKRDPRYFVTALLALCYARTDHRYKTLNWCNRSMAFARTQFGEELGNIDEENDVWLLCQVFIVLGDVLNYFSRQEEAIKSYQRALEHVDKKLDGDAYLKTTLHRLIGDNLRSRGLHDEALEEYRHAVDVLESYKDPQRFGVSFQKANIFSALGNTLMELQFSQEGSSFLQLSDRLQYSLQDELTCSVVALQCNMALDALHDCNHDRAFNLLTDALQAYREEHKKLDSNIAPMMAKLGVIHHIRSLTSDDRRNVADGNSRFQESLLLKHDISVALKYAYFLWDLTYVEAAMDRVERIVGNEETTRSLVTFEKHEELVIPQPLDREMGGELVDFPAQSFALFLLFLFYRDAGWGRLMDTVAAWLWRLAELEHCAMHWSILGYVLMEYQLFAQAAMAFVNASHLQNYSKQKTKENIAVNILLVYGNGLYLQELAKQLIMYEK